MLKQGITVLGIHDELLCHADNMETVKKQMVLSYRKIMKRALTENGKLGKNDPLPEHIQPVIG